MADSIDLEDICTLGHSAMLLEIAGLDKNNIANRTHKLASDDWSAFPPEEQCAYAILQARWTMTAQDYTTIKKYPGPPGAMSQYIGTQ